MGRLFDERSAEYRKPNSVVESPRIVTARRSGGGQPIDSRGLRPSCHTSGADQRSGGGADPTGRAPSADQCPRGSAHHTSRGSSADHSSGELCSNAEWNSTVRQR